MEASVPGILPAAPPPRRLQAFHFVPGTLPSFILRFGQFAAAVASFGVMVSASNFSFVTAFCFLVAAMVLQGMWSLSVATFEGYSWLLGRNLRNSPLLNLFTVGDWITAVITFAGACASAGIAVLVWRDVKEGCDAHYCGRYVAATVMAFLSCLMITASFLSTFWLLAIR